MHHGTEYRLHITKADKLILTKQPFIQPATQSLPGLGSEPTATGGLPTRRKCEGLVHHVTALIAMPPRAGLS